MCPVLSFGGMELHSYALFTWIGALAACSSALPALKRAGFPVGRSIALLLAACVSFLVCARLWNVAVNPANFAGALKWYSPKLAGLSLYGGLLGAMIALFAGARIAHIGVLPVLDAMVLPGGVAFCFARIGCFLNGCCGGVATHGPFGIVFPNSGSAGLPPLLSFVGSNSVHPTQLYELVGAAVGLAVAVWISSAYLRQPGVRFLLYAALFSTMRLAVLPLRVLTYPSAVKDVLYPALYLLVILGSVIGIFLLARRDKSSALCENDQ